MRTALDTNILSSLLSGEGTAPAISHWLSLAREQGALLISPVVYSEILAHPRASESFIAKFLARTEIGVDLRLDDRIWAETGKRFAQYVRRRRDNVSETPRRLLADFVIGAHALLQADRLMTMDTKRYATYFPELQLYPASALADPSLTPRF